MGCSLNLGGSLSNCAGGQQWAATGRRVIPKAVFLVGRAIPVSADQGEKLMLQVEWHSTDSSLGPWECFPESYLTPQSVGLHKAGPQGAPVLFLEVELGKVMTGKPTVPFGLCNFNLHET